MGELFDGALEVASARYPYPINRYEEYRDYFVFAYDDGRVRDGGPQSPIVVRKSDLAALTWDAAFFLGLDAGVESAGDVLAEGEVLAGSQCRGSRIARFMARRYYI